jgi:uncharacterized protein YndB with AHSA1/START domain
MAQRELPVFEISRLLAASPQSVYEAWADPKKMAQWSGPVGSQVEIIQGKQAAGHTTISRTASSAGPEMFSLCLWRELVPPSLIVWEQSFCTREGVKCAPPFFDDWPLTLLTEVSMEPRGQDTLLTLKWTPVEYTDAALAMFVKQMDSMTAGWGGSLGKLQEWLGG